MAKGLCISVLGMFVMACSGCGGSGGSSPLPVAQQTGVPKTVLVETYGDSTAAGCTPMQGAPAIQPCHTAGYAVSSPSPAQMLQSLLQTKYGSTVAVVDHGVAGNTIPAALTGDGVNLPWSQQMAQSKAQVVTFNFGINDSHAAANESVAAFQQNISQLIQIAKATGKTVVVITPNPTIDPANQSLAQYAASSVAAAKLWNVNVIDEFGALSSQPTWDSLLSDGVHPTVAGYEIKAQIDFQGIEPIVGFALTH